MNYGNIKENKQYSQFDPVTIMSMLGSLPGTKDNLFEDSVTDTEIDDNEESQQIAQQSSLFKQQNFFKNLTSHNVMILVFAGIFVIAFIVFMIYFFKTNK